MNKKPNEKPNAKPNETPNEKPNEKLNAMPDETPDKTPDKTPKPTPMESTTEPWYPKTRGPGRKENELAVPHIGTNNGTKHTSGKPTFCPESAL